MADDELPPNVYRLERRGDAAVPDYQLQTLGDVEQRVRLVAKDGHEYVALLISELRGGLVLTPEQARALAVTLVERARDLDLR